MTPIFSFPPDETRYAVPTWSHLDGACAQVARAVHESQLEFDLIVTLAKGGWAMTRSLADFTQIEQIASIGVKFYSGINQKEPTPLVYQDLPLDVSDLRILLFDDVADSGGSLQFVKQLLLERQARLVKTATLYYKPHSALRPDFFGETTDAWIIFPFELREMSQLLMEKWRALGVASRAGRAQLRQLGFPAWIVELV